jgi:hypothetical protein
MAICFPGHIIKEAMELGTKQIGNLERGQGPLSSDGAVWDYLEPAH